MAPSPLVARGSRVAVTESRDEIPGWGLFRAGVGAKITARARSAGKAHAAHLGTGDHFGVPL